MTWKSLRNPALMLFCALMACGCVGDSRRQSPSVIEMTLQVLPNPPQVGPSRVLVTLANEQGEPIDDAEVGLRAFHAGLKPVNARLSRTGAGRYEGPFNWKAAGQWRVNLTAALLGGHKISRLFGVRVKGGFDDEDLRLAGS